MFWHVNNDGVGRVGINLGGVSVLLAQHVPGKLNDGALQAQTDAQVRFFVGSCPVSRGDLALNTTGAKTSGY